MQIRSIVSVLEREEKSMSLLRQNEKEANLLVAKVILDILELPLLKRIVYLIIQI